MTVAVVLAAGLGSRLRPLTDDRPKCLVPVAGEPILLRALRLLAAWGATEAVVVTGYHASAVEAAVRGAALPTRCVYVPEHATTQNAVSLLRALEVAPAGDVVKLDGDLLFDPGVLTRLGHAGARVAVDDRQPVRDEAMKVAVRDGLATAFGKGLDRGSSAGESIGAERLDAACRALVRAALERAWRDGRHDLYYEDVYNDAVAAGARFEVARVGDLAWAEVDDPDDLRRAEALFSAR